MQIHCSTHSVILNAMATQYTRPLNGIYRPHWLVQWRHHCSRMCIPVHSPQLPGYIDVMQTVLIILETFSGQTLYTKTRTPSHTRTFLVLFGVPDVRASDRDTHFTTQNSQCWAFKEGISLNLHFPYSLKVSGWCGIMCFSENVYVTYIVTN